MLTLMIRRAAACLVAKAAVAALFLLLFATPAQALPALTTTRIASGLSRPLYVGAPPADDGRLFIVEQHTGRIRIYNKNTGTVNATPFLTVGGLSTGSEQGLLGLAFHPAYATNGYFFVNYTDASGNTHVTRYQVSANPDLANAASATTLFTLAQPFSNHNGGWLGFGPNDGYLYVSTGDGGSGNDPGNRAQNLTQPLGKLLRVDVDCTTLGSYGVPATNPFVGTPNDTRIWAYGLRNPWRGSFDRANGNLYIGDVGQNAVEEVDFQDASSAGGENYGWRLKEGTQLTGLGSTAGLTLVDPIHEYSHPPGVAVTGGYVYRGARYAFLQGTYFFGDYGIGKIWSFTYSGGALTNFTDRMAELQPDCGTLNLIASFGEDASGEIYIVDLDGEIFRIDALLKPGDANGDGKIDGGDLAIWQQNYDPLGSNGAGNTWDKGDWNDDNRIDGGDLALWQQNYAPLGYSSVSAGDALAMNAVPEPETIFLAMTGAMGMGWFVRRAVSISRSGARRR
jgi:glucose/arabinose dehydrogenase